MRWLVFALAIVLVSACSAESDTKSEPVPRRSASDLATVRAQAGIFEASPTARPATQTPTIASATATAEPAGPNPGFATDETMLATLLEPSDLSSSWTLGGEPGLPDATFCGALAIEEQFEPLGWAFGTYSAAGGEWAQQWVVRLVESDAVAAMDYARTSFTCGDEVRPLDSGNDVYWEYDSLSLAPVGDDSHARQFSITYENPVYTPMVGNVVFARHGEYVVVLLHYGFSADPATTEVMAQVAVARLAQIPDSSV